MNADARHAPRLILRSGVVLLCVAAWYFALAPATLGGPLSLVLVRGTSMEPTYVNGDLVIGYRAAELAVGDVVVFRGPGGSPVIHRLTGVEGERLVTRGDNLAVDDPWQTGPDDVLGTARVRIEGAGTVFRALGQPPVLGGLAALLVLTSVLWRSETRDPETLVAVGLVLLVGAAPLVVGRAASMTVTPEQLTALSVPGPFDTYMLTPGGGGGNSGGNGRP